MKGASRSRGFSIFGYQRIESKNKREPLYIGLCKFIPY